MIKSDNFIEDNSFLPAVSIVVIGLNEEAHLINTFEAIKRIDYPEEKIEVLYIDSGSIDQSIEIAKKYTTKIFVEKSFYPTAARGRNRGLQESSNNIVHFIDGDVEIGEHYLSEAVNKLLSTDNLVAVTGYISEKHTNNNLLNRLFSSVHSDKKEKFVHQTKAGGTYRKDLLLKLDGYDERIKLGEETELGERIINSGYKLVQIDELMGTHDYDFSGISSLLELHIKMGESVIIQSLLGSAGAYWKLNRIRNYSNILQNFFLVLSIIFTFYFQTVYIVVVAVFLSFVWLFFKLALRGELKRDKILFHIIMHLMKPITFIGQIKTIFKLIFLRSFRTTVIVKKSNLFIK